MSKTKTPTRGVTVHQYARPCSACSRAAKIEYQGKRWCVFCFRKLSA